MAVNGALFFVFTLLGLVSSQMDAPTQTKDFSRGMIDAVNNLTQLNSSYPVGRKINFSPPRPEDEGSLKIKYPPRSLRIRSSTSANKSSLPGSNRGTWMARKSTNLTREDKKGRVKVAENRSEVDATMNELIGEKLASIEKRLVEELLMAYDKITKEAKFRPNKRNESVSDKPFRIVVTDDKNVEKTGDAVNRVQIIGNPLSTNHVMRITKNNINTKQTNKINETEVAQGFQDFGKKFFRKRESPENDLETSENSRKFKPPHTYLTGFRPIVRRDLSVIGPIPRGFSGMRSADSTYDGIHSGEIPPPIWPPPPFPMVMPPMEQQPRGKIEESPSLELLIFKYEEALKQYQEAVRSYKKYYDKYLSSINA